MIYSIALIAFILLSVLLIFVVLIQESKSSGLGAAFGGADSGDSVFGTSTADVLKVFTGWLTIAFVVGCVALSLWTTSLGRTSVQQAPIMVEQQGSSK